MSNVVRLPIARPAPRSIQSRKMRQVLSSTANYVHELGACRTPGDLAGWVYYKAPTFFPLRAYPSVINLEVTNHCNFACPHCPRSALNKGRELGHMDFEVFRKLVDESAGRARQFRFIGLGEPCLHPRFGDMMRLLKTAGLKARPYTNGTLFETFAPEEILSWALEEIVVSIDGVDARSFERLRVGGKFDALYRALETFEVARKASNEPRTRIQVRHVIMPTETPAQLAAFARFWRSRFADSVKFNLLGEAYDRPRAGAQWRPSCRDIRREMHIRHDGRVPLCGYAGDREWIGDVAAASVESIWLSDRLQEVRRLHQNRDLTTIGFCKTCQFW